MLGTDFIFLLQKPLLPQLMVGELLMKVPWTSSATYQW